MKRKITWLLAIFMLMIILGGLYLTKGKDKEISSRKIITINKPIIMIPGSGGDSDSYDSMIKKLKKKTSGITVLKLTVFEDGSVKASGKLTSDSSYPLITVAFSDSSDASVPKQGKWFSNAIEYLKKHYEFKQYNYLGHSNGGLIITYYFERYIKSDDPKADRLMFLGAPFNGVEQSENVLDADGKLVTISDDLKPLLTKKQRIPHDIKVLNLYSDVKSDSDGIVPVESVKAGKQIYGQTASYEERKLSKQVPHQWLIDGNSCTKEAEQFLFSKN